MVAQPSESGLRQNESVEPFVGERAREVDLRRLQERALRVHAMLVWVMPLQVLGALAVAWSNGPEVRFAQGLPRWLVVGVLGLFPALGTSWLAARSVGMRPSRLGMAALQLAMYGVMQIAAGGPLQGQVHEYVSLALMSLYHDVPVMAVAALLGVALDGVGFAVLRAAGETQSFTWEGAAAQSLAGLVATALYVVWDRREQWDNAEREARLELETERRRETAQQLREVVARYRRVVDSNLIGICFWDGTGQVLDANDAYLKLLGYDRKDLAAGALKHENLTPPEWRPATNSTLLEIRKRGFAAPTEKEYVRKDGARIQVLRGSASVDGSNLGVSFVLDLREMKRLERDLKAVLEANIIGVVFWDGDRWTDANDAFLDMIGYSRDDLQSTSLRMSWLVSAEQAGIIADVRAEIEATGRFRLREMDLVRRDKQLVPTMIAGVRLDREAVHGVAFVLDMTQQKHAERELAHARDQLEIRVEERTAQLERANAELSLAKETAESASRAKSQFLANMSHEIRTPMTAIQGFAELMQDPELDDAERRAYAHTIRRNSDHLLSILDDVLDLSRIEADRMELAPERTPLVPLLQDVLELMQPRATAKGLTLRLRLATPVPTWIVVDPLRLRQVLLNLVGNAVKFTEQGEVTVVVTMQPGADELPALTIAVEDTGIGIEPHEMDKLFQPFAQADASTTRRFGGSGLGLAISRRLAGLMGGRLTASSLTGRGSTFSLTIDPGVSGEAPLEMLPERVISDVRESVRHKRDELSARARVLLAEDGVDNQLLITTYLRHAGIEVAVAADGREAVAQVAAAEASGRPFGLVLMDMQMPDVDGYAATRQLRDRGYTRPIVALTAHAMAGDRQECLAAGCSDYIAKPLSRAGLLAAVRRNLTSTDLLGVPIADDPDDEPTEPPEIV